MDFATERCITPLIERWLAVTRFSYRAKEPNPTNKREMLSNFSNIPKWIYFKKRNTIVMKLWNYRESEMAKESIKVHYIK